MLITQSSGRNGPNHPKSSHSSFMAQDEVKKQQQQKPSGWLCEVKALPHSPQSVVFALRLFLLKCLQTTGTDADEEKTIEMRP